MHICNLMQYQFTVLHRQEFSRVLRVLTLKRALLNAFGPEPAVN